MDNIRLAVVTAGLLSLGFAAYQKATLVPYSEVGSRVQIVGKFGHPLGSILKLSGHRVGNSRGPTMMGGGNFKIDSLDGKPIKGNTVLWIEEVKTLPPGTKRTVVGYETGSMVGTPSGAVREGAPVSQAVWQFYLDFKVVRVD